MQAIASMFDWRSRLHVSLVIWLYRNAIALRRWKHLIWPVFFSHFKEKNLPWKTWLYRNWFRTSKSPSPLRLKASFRRRSRDFSGAYLSLKKRLVTFSEGLMQKLINLISRMQNCEEFRAVSVNCTQRTGLCAGWEIVFRLPGTAAD